MYVLVTLATVFIALVVFALWFSQRDAPPVPVHTPPPAPQVPAAPRTVLEAADLGDLAALKRMLEERPERIGLRDEGGWTALHHACYRDHQPVIDFLLEKGADPNAVAVGECVPIHMAATESTGAAIRSLVKAGADTNAPDDTGLTALHYAALPGRLDVVEALIAHGAAVNMKDAKQETALDVARRLDDEAVARIIETSGGLPGSEVTMKDVLAALPDGAAKRQVPRHWHLDIDSPEMTDAIARAKDGLQAFLAHLTEHPDALAAVKFAVRGQGIVEYVWGEVLQSGSDVLNVTVTTPPVAVAPPPHPTEVEVSEVVDWQLKLDDDRTAGGYSQRATFEAIRTEYGFLPPDIEAELAQLVDL